jgi:hypothetical protein
MYDCWTFLHTGHIGDIIAFLPSFKKLGGSRLVITDGKGFEPMRGFKYNSLAPLIQSQGIPIEFNPEPGQALLDMSNWRKCYEHEVSLSDVQARYCGAVSPEGHLEIKEPWISVEPDESTKGRVIFNRTPRYRNPEFDWAKVYKHFGEKALFVGTDEEHEEFENLFGAIERKKAADCLEVARLIQGSDFFVGNQSSACWIAMSLFKPLLQEVDLVVKNSIIPFDGAYYPRDGKIDFSVL